ncbi:MAG: hypothetical protein IJ524_04660 [Bacteroidales bacterium]|nr:hypothetical protein [Bacteroidales bacterium]
MKRIAYILMPLLLAACTTKTDTVELTEWQFKYNGEWYPATVPGFIHTDLMANGLIPDPYLSTNEDSVRWVADSVWTYRTTLLKKDLPEGDSLRIVFEGLAGRADIRISNTQGTYEHLLWVPDADNMFCQYAFSFHNIEDSINVKVTFIPLEDSIEEAFYGIPLPDRRAFTRIAPYQQGWDWGPKLPTCGIWKRVYITNRPHPLTPLRVERGADGFPYRNVRLMQEQDSIGQSFYFVADTGVSTPLSNRSGGGGEAGVRLFIKGANWIPVHSFPIDDKANRDRYRLLLTSAKEAGFNMLRVWGGGIYEHDYFFDLCDSLGLMVWMDFNFSTMLYPDNTEMLESIKKEARQNVTRIAKYPCVVLWCGNNEVKNGWEDWGWQSQFNWTPEQRARLEHAIDTIFGLTPGPSPIGEGGGKHKVSTPLSNRRGGGGEAILAQAVRDCDPYGRPYITTSPLYGWGHPECTTHGDSHYWGVWWGEQPFEVYKEKTGRFMSEYGFQSYPMLSTIKQFCPEDQLYIDSPTLRSHQKHGRGLQIIDKAMRQYYGFDSKSLSLEDFCYVSQLLQAWGTGYGILCHISDPRCDGTLYWQLNDCWPVASWSSIDYYGNWKALHYRAQALFDDNVDLKKWEQYYSVYPKDRSYPEPKFKFNQAWQSDGSLVVTMKAETDLFDVFIDTEPHIDGHFTRNFFDLKAGESVTTTFVPVDPKADVGKVKVTVRTLNDLYRNHSR